VATTISHDPAETLELGRGEGERCRAGDVIALCGDLGAGKTQFVKGLAAALRTDAEVTSPTFTLIHEYAGGTLPVYHFDFYRIGSAAEALALGLDEYLDDGGVSVMTPIPGNRMRRRPHRPWRRKKAGRRSPGNW